MQLANWSSSAHLNDRASAAREQEGLGIAERLVLPLHGAPPLLDKSAVEARQRINDTLESFVADGRTDGTVRDGVNAIDVIMCSALTA
jgi:hypothetical protein